MTSPRARELVRWVRVRVQVLLLLSDALDGAKNQITAQGKLVDRADELPREVNHPGTPRPVMILPSNSTAVRRLIAGLVCTRRNA
jgi:hypothetical protein